MNYCVSVTVTHAVFFLEKVDLLEVLLVFDLL